MLLAEAIMEVMAETIYNDEIIFVNYGNDDQSWHTIIQLSNNFSVIRGINLEGGYGQTVALHSGFSFAKGDVIIAIDGNLRHDPAYMPVFLAYIERGYEVVCGLRKQQKIENSRFFAVDKIITQKTIYFQYFSFFCNFGFLKKM